MEARLAVEGSRAPSPAGLFFSADVCADAESRLKDSDAVPGLGLSLRSLSPRLVLRTARRPGRRRRRRIRDEEGGIVALALPLTCYCGSKSSGEPAREPALGRFSLAWTRFLPRTRRTRLGLPVAVWCACPSALSQRWRHGSLGPRRSSRLEGDASSPRRSLVGEGECELSRVE